MQSKKKFVSSDTERGVGIVQQVVLPMILLYGTCMEHNHRVFITPEFSIVARCEHMSSCDNTVLSITLDFTNYRD